MRKNYSKGELNSLLKRYKSEQIVTVLRQEEMELVNRKTITRGNRVRVELSGTGRVIDQPEDLVQLG